MDGLSLPHLSDPSRAVPAALPLHPFTPMQRLATIAKTTVMLAALTLAATWCLTSTLDDMTRADCHAGIKAACDQLK